MRKLAPATLLLAASTVFAYSQIPPSDLPGNFPWNPGMMSKGGIPSRTTVCATLSPTGSDQTAAVQAAIEACPANQVLMLGPGEFTINTGPVLIDHSMVLRGSGAGVTILKKANGTRPRLSTVVSGTNLHTPANQDSLPDYAPIVVAGLNQFPNPDSTTSQNLTADGAQGSLSITVPSTAAFTPGAFVLLDEISGSSWQAGPGHYVCTLTSQPCAVQVWGNDRFVWHMHNPWQGGNDDQSGGSNSQCPFDGAFVSCAASQPGVERWFARPDRPFAEIKEVASVSGNTVTFTSPLSSAYRTSHKAQLTAYTNTPSGGDNLPVTNVGVENLTLTGGSANNISFAACAYCWGKGIESTEWLGYGVDIVESFRVELRDSYIHTGAWPVPGGGGYGIALEGSASEILVENNIAEDENQSLVVLGGGAGSVVGYNYFDNSWDATDPANEEGGLHASHWAGAHHVLLEGNYAPNFDTDWTHGSAVLLTPFRNWLSGYRRDVQDSVGTTGNLRGGASEFGARGISFIGNVIGTQGKMSGWTYTDPAMACDANGNNCTGVNTTGNWAGNDIWELGYDHTDWAADADTVVLSTVIRDGNWDWLTSSQHWHNTTAKFTIPNSLYLAAVPAFFGSCQWPWVDPSTGATFTLPAQQRFVAGTPNVVASCGATTQPTASLTATPASIVAGASSSLNWSGANLGTGGKCTGTGFSTGSTTPTSGTVSVTPGVTSNYSVSCTGSAGTATASATVTVSAATNSETAGETSILPNGVANASGFFVMQNITLPKAGTLQSLSIYIFDPGASGGKARIAFYKPNPSGMCTTGAKWKTGTKTAPFMVTKGWNTQPVLNVASYPAGTYCLAWEVSNNGVAVAQGATAGTSEVWVAHAFASFPLIWPAPTVTDGNHISAYATFSIP